jgi:hypothetical protein
MGHSIAFNENNKKPIKRYTPKVTLDESFTIVAFKESSQLGR